MDELVAVLDADVLVPILTCDLLLTAFDHDLYRPVVTPKILDEVERNLLRVHPDLDPDRLRHRVEIMRRALVLHTRADSDEAVAGINVKDHHIVATALDAEAHVVVTNDRRLRREITGLGLSLTASTADTFAVELAERDPETIEDVIAVLVSKRVQRPVTREELLTRLSRPLPSFVLRMQDSS